jgi:S-adenosylmethionine:tRNA ribosyltransferase-isomerase
VFLRAVDSPAEAGERWEALARPSSRLRAGGQLVVGDGERLKLVSLLGEGRWVVEAAPGRSMVDIMQAYGLLPVPPYIKTYPREPASYQTVYASCPGSVAAPTAGLHFTAELLERLHTLGVGTAYVTLHVGLDTFLPIREQVVEEHRIHTENWSIGAGALRELRLAVDSGRRIVAVGTTAARVLETIGAIGGPGALPDEGTSGTTDIFITPGHRFQLVDALLTNFHLPRSTVLAMTMAFGGVERIKRAYTEAIGRGYRFFSFGDAMLIEKEAQDDAERG